MTREPSCAVSKVFQLRMTLPMRAPNSSAEASASTPWKVITAVKATPAFGGAVSTE